MKQRPDQLHKLILVASMALSSPLAAMGPGELLEAREYLFKDVQASWDSALNEELTAEELALLDNDIWSKANLLMRGEGLPASPVAPKKPSQPAQPVDPDADSDQTAQPEQQALMRNSMSQLTLKLDPDLVSKLKKRQIKFQIFQNRALNLSHSADPSHKKAVLSWTLQSVTELYQMAWILALQSPDQLVKCQQFKESQILKHQLPREPLPEAAAESVRLKALQIQGLDSHVPGNSATNFFHKICETPLAFSKVEQTKVVEKQVNADFSRHLDGVAKDYVRSIKTVLESYTAAANDTKVDLKTAEIFSLENRVQNSASKMDLVAGDLLQLVKLIGTLEKLNYESLGASYKAPQERTDMLTYRDRADAMFQTLFEQLNAIDGCRGLSFPGKSLPTDQVQGAMQSLTSGLKQCAETIENRLKALPGSTDAAQAARHQEFAQGVIFLTKSLTGQK